MTGNVKTYSRLMADLLVSYELWSLVVSLVILRFIITYWRKSGKRQTSRENLIYQALDIERNEIRLLSLIPGLKDEMIRCELRHVSLTDQPSYAALSYCWGDHSHMSVIEVNGIRVTVTANLEECLRQMRPRWSSIELWIDALSIDQSNKSERATQVLRMFSIYQEARVVVIWLGAAADGSDNVMNALAADQGNDQHFDIGARFARSHFAASQPPSPAHLQAFLSRPYWRRTWIIQEVAAAREICILCGERTIELRDPTRLLEIFASDNLIDPVHLSAIRRLFMVRNERRDQKPPCLLDLLYRTSDASSTEVLDKVFGLLGIVRDRATFITEPNYRQTPRQLCQAMAWNAIMETGFLDIIFLAAYHSFEHLPSWCPNFLAAGEWLPKLVKYASGDDHRKRLNVMANRWNTSGETRAGISNTSIDLANGVLRVKGLHVNDVEYVGPIIEDQLWCGLRKVFGGQVCWGWADPCVQSRDQAFIMHGCTIPVVLRPIESRPGCYRYIGRVYIPKALGGQFVQALVTDAKWLELY